MPGRLPITSEISDSLCLLMGMGAAGGGVSMVPPASLWPRQRSEDAAYCDPAKLFNKAQAQTPHPDTKHMRKVPVSVMYQGWLEIRCDMMRFLGSGTKILLSRSLHSGDRSRPGGNSYWQPTSRFISFRVSTPGSEGSCHRQAFGQYMSCSLLHPADVSAQPDAIYLQEVGLLGYVGLDHSTNIGEMLSQKLDLFLAMTSRLPQVNQEHKVPGRAAARSPY